MYIYILLMSATVYVKTAIQTTRDETNLVKAYMAIEPPVVYYVLDRNGIYDRHDRNGIYDQKGDRGKKQSQSQILISDCFPSIHIIKNNIYT
jgi:hypothetical protein